MNDDVLKARKTKNKHKQENKILKQKIEALESEIEALTRNASFWSKAYDHLFDNYQFVRKDNSNV